jgi:hypothetical protein
MADRRNTPAQPSVVYDSRLYQVGALWAGTSRASGNPILTGEISLGLMGPKDVLITQNTRQDRAENSPSHFVFIRIPLRRGGTNGQNNEQIKDDDDLPF